MYKFVMVALVAITIIGLPNACSAQSVEQKMGKIAFEFLGDAALNPGIDSISYSIDQGKIFFKADNFSAEGELKLKKLETLNELVFRAKLVKKPCTCCEGFFYEKSQSAFLTLRLKKKKKSRARDIQTDKRIPLKIISSK